MARIEVPGRGSFDVPETFTYAELDFIKQTAGVRPAELSDALRAGDAMLHVAVAVIAMRRAGQKVDVQDVVNMEFGAIDWHDEAEEPGDPPDGAGV